MRVALNQTNCISLPVSGTSVGLMILLICSIDCKSGERPCEREIHFLIRLTLGAQTQIKNVSRLEKGQMYTFIANSWGTENPSSVCSSNSGRKFTI